MLVLVMETYFSVEYALGIIGEFPKSLRKALRIVVPHGWI